MIRVRSFLLFARSAVPLLAMALLLAAGCGGGSSEPRESVASAILAGEHKLRRMVERTDLKSGISGGFFLFMGSVTGETNAVQNVKFAWQMNDGTYALSSLPLEKIRVKFDESKETPVVRFRWRPWNSNTNPQIQKLMDEYVVYALVICREADWPVKIQLPLN